MGLQPLCMQAETLRKLVLYLESSDKPPLRVIYYFNYDDLTYLTT